MNPIRRWPFLGSRPDHSPAGGSFLKLIRRSESGISLVEIVVGVAILGMVVSTGLGTLIILNRNAASTRLMTNAREIVQRNIETAIGVPFPDYVSYPSDGTPPILKIASSQEWNEATGSPGSNPVPIYASATGQLKVTGKLTRTVTAEPNGASAMISRITFRLEYELFGRKTFYELTTLRAQDQA